MPEDFDRLLGEVDRATALRDAFIRASEVVGQIPLTELSGPLRDHITLSIYDHIRPHCAADCQSCMDKAMHMSIVALGWDDAKTPRGSVQERMDALKAQYTIALEFIGGLHDRSMGGGK